MGVVKKAKKVVKKHAKVVKKHAKVVKHHKKIAKKHAKKGKKVAHHKKVIKRIKKVHRRLVKRAAAYAITIHKIIILRMRKIKLVKPKVKVIIKKHIAKLQKKGKRVQKRIVK